MRTPPAAPPPPDLDAVLAGTPAPLASFLAFYLTRHAPRPLPQPDALGLLAWLDEFDTRRLWRENTGSAFLVRALTLLSDQAIVLEQRHQRAWGGDDHPQRIRPNEAAQQPRDPRTLPTTTTELCELLDQEAPLLARLFRASQQYYWANNYIWMGYHQAFAVVLMRVYDLWAALRTLADWWYADLCLRAAFRKVWEDLFGLDVPLPTLLKKQPLRLWQEREVFWRLMQEERDAQAKAQRAGQPLARWAPPRIWTEVIARWHAGDLPPELRRHATLPPEHAWRVRAYV